MPVPGRIYHVEDGKVITTDGTQIYDLEGVSPISSINIMLKLTANGVTPTGHPSLAIPTFEVVDGSTPLVSFNGSQMQGVDIFTRPNMGHRRVDWMDNVMTIWTASYQFGRHEWDKQLAFLPGNFHNPQLRIQHNYDLGGAAPDAGSLDVWFNLFDEVEVSPVGFLATRESHKITAVNDQVTYIDLPADRTLRALFINSLATGKAPHSQFNKLRLDVDGDRRIIFDESTSDLAKNDLYRGPQIFETHRGAANISPVTFYMTPTYEQGGVAGEHAYNGKHVAIHTSTGGTFTVQSEAGGIQIAANIQGYCPHGMIRIPFGEQGDLDDWFDTADVKNLRLRITHGSSVTTADIGVIVQQLFRY